MSTATKQERLTAGELYDRQNKMIHKAFATMGMPYHENKDYWLGVVVEIIRRVVGSLSDLTLGERWSVLARFSKQTKVYNPYVPKGWGAWKKGDPEPVGTASHRPMAVPGGKQAMVNKIHAILADMRLPWTYVDTIASGRFGVEFVEWLEAPELHKVVQMMVVHQKRKGGVA